MDTSCLYVTVCTESLYLKGAIGYIEYRQLYPNWIYGSRCISKKEIRVQNAYLNWIFGTIGSHIESWDSRYENLEFRKLKRNVNCLPVSGGGNRTSGWLPGWSSGGWIWLYSTAAAAASTDTGCHDQGAVLHFYLRAV